MRLFLDLSKAVPVPSVGTSSVSVQKDARSYNESFNRRSVGAMGGDASPDLPEVGKQRRNSSESLDDALEEDRKRDSEISQERNLTPKDSTEEEEEEPTSKALAILKSFNNSLSSIKVVPNPTEVEYLTSVAGYSPSDVYAGRAKIVGLERAKFNSWLLDKLTNSVQRLR